MNLFTHHDTDTGVIFTSTSGLVHFGLLHFPDYQVGVVGAEMRSLVNQADKMLNGFCNRQWSRIVSESGLITITVDLHEAVDKSTVEQELAGLVVHIEYVAGVLGS